MLIIDSYVCLNRISYCHVNVKGDIRDKNDCFILGAKLISAKEKSRNILLDFYNVDIFTGHFFSFIGPALKSIQDDGGNPVCLVRRSFTSLFESAGVAELVPITIVRPASQAEFVELFEKNEIALNKQNRSEHSLTELK